MRRIDFWLFVALALVQLAVPASMITSRERTLAEGESFRFRTAPVDPYDPFRGRFVALSLEAQQVMVSPREGFRRGERVFAPIAVDKEGFAFFPGLSRSRPAAGAYIKTRILYDQGADTVRIMLPFDRYYAEETQAPEMERAYWRHSRREQRDAFILVKVREGMGVLEELYIGGLPVGEFILQEDANAEEG